MLTIRAWLEKQDRGEVHGTFLYNWSLTLRAHDRGCLSTSTRRRKNPSATNGAGWSSPTLLSFAAARVSFQPLTIGQALSSNVGYPRSPTVEAQTRPTALSLDGTSS